MKLLILTSEPLTAEDVRGVCDADDTEVLVVAPALHSSPLRFWVSDADEAISRAADVAKETVDKLSDEGIDAAGDTGESEPAQAIADTLAVFPAERIAIFRRPEPEQDYREDVSPAALEKRFGIPVVLRELRR